VSRLTLPEGQSVRQIAERLGVPVADLLKHAGVADAEAPLPVAKAIEVPDGFLKSRTKKDELKDAVITKAGAKGGMNTWLALDIEQKRTRAAGGMNAHAATEDENEALTEARRAYVRFEAESNELAITLYGRASSTVSVDVRGRAFAGQALALAQRCLMFGEPLGRGRAQALSAAKAALLADPKLAEAHLGMALALLCGADDDGRREARATLDDAIRLGSVEARVELAALDLHEANLRGARQGLHEARDADLARLFEVQGELALAEGDAPSALERFTAAATHTSTYLRPRVGMARAHRASGDAAAAKRELEAACAEAQHEHEKRYLRELFSRTR
jgi:hypothetical protein